MKKVLTIAGSDCSGGAGIQADLKTIAAHGAYGMSVITALTAQNTTGVSGVHPVPPEMVQGQIQAVFEDIFPDAVKVGMVAEIPIIEAIADSLARYAPRHIVVDPVMISTSGHALMRPDAQAALIHHLLSLATVITPNLAEAQALSGIAIHSKMDMVRAAEKIRAFVPGAVLIKGGHLEDCADDLLCHGSETTWFPCRRVDNPNNHGTGCTLSSAIACNLAAGHELVMSIELAKAYVTGALEDGMDLGAGSGPLNHGYLSFPS